MKIYVLMPTYNDCDTVIYSLKSIFEQTYENFEVIIVDDGSTDNTKNVIGEFKKEYDKHNKIRYIYQENQDQLNALKNASKYIDSGDSLVYILHSDDVIYDSKVFERVIDLFNDKDIDAVISDIGIIDEKGNDTGIQRVKKYVKKEYIIPLQLLWLGRNLYTDCGFYRSKFFLGEVYNNYLTWNGPFWLDLDRNVLAKVSNANFSFFKYRVFPENYINNSIGRLCVINGEIRVLTRLLNNYFVPCYRIQYFVYRVFNKLGIEKLFRPIYFNCSTRNKSKVIDFVLRRRFSPEEIANNKYLSSLSNFYRNYRSRTVEFDKLDRNFPIYTGSDLRIFNKKVVANDLPDIYDRLLDEMKLGFDEIVVYNAADKEKMDKIVRFLAIYPYVKINIKK